MPVCRKYKYILVLVLLIAGVVQGSADFLPPVNKYYLNRVLLYMTEDLITLSV